MIDLGTAYQDSRRRLTALVAALPDDGGDRDPRSIDMACCPGWTVHDVVAHLAAVADDVLDGRLTGPPNDDETAAQVARWAGVPTGRVLDGWAEKSPALEKLLSEVPVWPALMDVLSHEHDVRQALGEPGARELPEIQTCAYVSLKWMLTTVDMAVTLGGRAMRPEGADQDRRLLELNTTAWEAFRFRLGRRSRAQIRAMDWRGDPAPVLDRITVFGPSPHDIIE